MKDAPLILISASADQAGVEFKDASLSLSQNYPRAIQDAGGIPWVLPCLPDGGYLSQAVRRCDGVMLTGGDDLQPGLYIAGQLAPALRRTIATAAPERDLFELLLLAEVFRRRKPLLAICRGHQLLNVALGGTLVVDIPLEMPDALNHSRLDLKDKIVHKVAIENGSELALMVGQMPMEVNSSHHQAVKKVAKPLRANAVSTDGIVEGLELAPEARHFLPFLLAVQFHPERLYARHQRHYAIFEAFTRACRWGSRSHV